MEPNPTSSRKSRTRAVLVAAAAMVALVSCSNGEDDPEAATATDGTALYEQACASCHGSDLRGTDQGPSHLSQVYAPDHHPDASFRAAITQGSPAHHWQFGDMAPVAGLDDDEIDVIIAYIRDQQEMHGFEPYPPE